MQQVIKVLFAMIYAPDKGGSGAPIYCYNLMQSLYRDQHESGIIFSVHPSYQIQENAFWNSHPIYMEHPPIFDNQPKVTNSIAFKDMTSSEVEDYIKKFSEGITTTVTKFGYNVIHVQHGMYIGYAAALVKQKLNIPYIVTLHIMELNFLEEFPDPLMALKAMTSADKIIALTEAQKQRLINEYSKDRIIKLEMLHKKINKAAALKNYDKLIGAENIDPEKIIVSPLGIDTKLFKFIENPAIPNDLRNVEFKPDQKLVYFAGRLIDMKGIKHLLSAEAIYNKHKDTHTIVIGGGALANYMTELAKANHQIHYLGFKEQSEMPQYHNYVAQYNAVFCVPSSSEGLSLVYLEAMGAGLPVVACCKKDMGDLDFMQAPNAEFVNFGDVSTLGQKIFEKLNHKKNNLGRRYYRQQVKKYNLENMYRLVKNIYLTTIF